MEMKAGNRERHVQKHSDGGGQSNGLQSTTHWISVAVVHLCIKGGQTMQSGTQC